MNKEKLILELLKEKPLTRKELVEKWPEKINSETLQRDLALMRSKGLLIANLREGSKAKEYSINSTGEIQKVEIPKGRTIYTDKEEEIWTKIANAELAKLPISKIEQLYKLGYLQRSEEDQKLRDLFTRYKGKEEKSNGKI